MDEIITPPQSVDAEQAVIGSILIDSRCLPDVLPLLEPSDFYLDAHRNIYQAASTLHDAGKTIDPVTILDAMRLDDTHEAARYFRRLMEQTPTAAHVKVYAGIVRETSARRSMQEAAAEAVRLVGEGADLERIQAALERAQEVALPRQMVQVDTFPDAVLRLYDALDERVKSGGKLSGIPTGYGELDRLTGGLHGGNMIVVAARSGMGKSAFALNVAVHAARTHPVLFFSLEMNTVELTERMCSNLSDIPLRCLRDADLTDARGDILTHTANQSSDLDLRIIDAPALDMPHIARICRRLKPALVVLDHIGLIQMEQRQNRREAMDALSRSIKVLAKALNIPIVAVAQLNRAIMTRANKTPMLSDLRESGAIEQDADVVLFVDRPAYYDPGESERAANIIVAKNRHGETGTVPLLWFGEKQRFTETI